MKIIGLAGGIGSGKSTAAHLLERLGAKVLDLDKAGHDVLLKSGPAYQPVVAAFGRGILQADGEIDRARLGKIVFEDKAALQKLNGIMHPVIDRDVEARIKECRRQGVKVLVLEAAAMLESNRSWLADEIWVTLAPENAVVQRIKDRPGYSEEIVRSRIRAQMSNAEKLKRADVVIQNDGTPEELREKVLAEWEKLQKRL